MITKLHLENFRGIQKTAMDLGKITVLTGANNSGKSTAIYGLLALKNVVLNPNQPLDAFLNLGFLNLGGFSQTVHLKKEALKIRLGIEVLRNKTRCAYSACLGKKQSELSVEVFKPYDVSLNLEVSFPYPANQTTGAEVRVPSGIAKVMWNGITPTVSITPESELNGVSKQNEEPNERKTDRIVTKLVDQEDSEYIVADLSNSLNAAPEELRAVDFVPLRRGFTQPTFSSVPMQQQLLKEEELATLLAGDRDLEAKVAHYLEQIVPRTFSVRATLGTANFNLQSRDRATGLVCDLVNEGFGTNQLVWILAKSLRSEMQTICIEESEIHLHPELLDKLVNVFVKLVQDEEKQFIISTHNEHIVLSLLNAVGQGKLKPEDINVYYFSKKGKKTSIERQTVNEKGQMKGGLKGFYEVELAQVREFFGSPESY
ncbi:MAG: AAA family ATPase [Phycisphaerae bacterium]|nr:AAA family ATPase [Phycisphaerae bacterium]